MHYERSSKLPLENDEISRLLCEARAGSSEALGRLIDAGRNYLMAIARQAIPDALKAKAGESDLVQETAFEAQRDFASFGGESADELLAWLRRILLNNVSNFSRHYEQTEKRKVKLEFPLDSSGHNPSEIKDRGPSPSACAISRELQQRIDACLDRLPSDMKRAIVLRNREHLSFAEMSLLLGRSIDATRKLWVRAIERMQAELRDVK